MTTSDIVLVLGYTVKLFRRYFVAAIGSKPDTLCRGGDRLMPGCTPSFRRLRLRVRSRHAPPLRSAIRNQISADRAGGRDLAAAAPPGCAVLREHAAVPRSRHRAPPRHRSA